MVVAAWEGGGRWSYGASAAAMVVASIGLTSHSSLVCGESLSRQTYIGLRGIDSSLTFDSHLLTHN